MIEPSNNTDSWDQITKRLNPTLYNLQQFAKLHSADWMKLGWTVNVPACYYMGKLWMVFDTEGGPKELDSRIREVVEKAGLRYRVRDRLAEEQEKREREMAQQFFDEHVDTLLNMEGISCAYVGENNIIEIGTVDEKVQLSPAVQELFQNSGKAYKISVMGNFVAY